jgi:hypothetical protein
MSRAIMPTIVIPTTPPTIPPIAPFEIVCEVEEVGTLYSVSRPKNDQTVTLDDVGLEEAVTDVGTDVGTVNLGYVN